MTDPWWKQPIPATWEGVHKARLSVPGGASSVFFYHHAKKLIRLDSDILDDILSAITQEIEVVSYVRGEKKGARRGVNPAAINANIRKKLRDASAERAGRKWTFEAVVEDGIIYDAVSEAESAKKGFDLARYDMRHNILALRSLCFGKRPLRNGQKHWDAQQQRPHWKALMEEMRVADPDSVPDKEEPTVLGEIQFGVRTSLDHDLLRLLKARADLSKVDDEIDLYIYVCPTQGLAGTLAGNTVNLKMVRDHIVSLGSVLPIPTIIVPMDIEMDPSGGDFVRPLSDAEAANVKAVTHKRLREDEA